MLKALLEPIRLGNQYRLEKYGPRETLEGNTKRSREVYRKYREEQLPKTLSMFASSEEIRDNETTKQKFSYWKTWTGARFVTEENPNGGNGEIGVCNPVTGYWEQYK
mgnify:CR=1 FL=1